MRELGSNRKAYEYVFNYFAEQVMKGKLRLNDKLRTERDVAEDLGVSRNSVREAYHILEMMGLIECIQGSGNYVRCQPQEYMMRAISMITMLQDITFSEVLAVRRGYEITSLNLAMSAITEEELGEMHDILVRMDQPMSIQESVSLDIAFHRLLVHASHNRLLILYTMLIGEMLDKFIESLRPSILADRRRAAQLSKAHWDIYQALVNRDIVAGHDAMTRHFEIVGEHLKKMEKKVGASPRAFTEE